MRKAKSINELLGESNGKKSKGIEFEYYYSKKVGKENANVLPSDFKTVIHLGYCNYDKTDYFLASDNDCLIHVFSGKLNDGTY